MSDDVLTRKEFVEHMLRLASEHEPDREWSRERLLAHDAAQKKEIERLRQTTLVAEAQYVKEYARVEALEKELATVDEALARRTALDDAPDRYTEIFRACKRAGEADAAEAENARLRKIVEEAPHEFTCGSVLTDNPPFYPCNCFKSKAALAQEGK